MRMPARSSSTSPDCMPRWRSGTSTSCATGRCSGCHLADAAAETRARPGRGRLPPHSIPGACAADRVRDRRDQRVARALHGKQHQPFCLRIVLSLFFARSRKPSSCNTFQNSSMTMMMCRPSMPVSFFRCRAFGDADNLPRLEGAAGRICLNNPQRDASSSPNGAYRLRFWLDKEGSRQSKSRRYISP